MSKCPRDRRKWTISFAKYGVFQTRKLTKGEPSYDELIQRIRTQKIRLIVCFASMFNAQIILLETIFGGTNIHLIPHEKLFPSNYDQISRIAVNTTCGFTAFPLRLLSLQRLVMKQLDSEIKTMELHATQLLEKLADFQDEKKPLRLAREILTIIKTMYWLN